MKTTSALLILLTLSGCQGTQSKLAQFTGADVCAAATAAAQAGDGPASACFKPICAALGGGSVVPGAALLLEGDRLCKGLLP